MELSPTRGELQPRKATYPSSALLTGFALREVRRWCRRLLQARYAAPQYERVNARSVICKVTGGGRTTTSCLSCNRWVGTRLRRLTHSPTALATDGSCHHISGRTLLSRDCRGGGKTIALSRHAAREAAPCYLGCGGFQCPICCRCRREVGSQPDASRSETDVWP